MRYVSPKLIGLPENIARLVGSLFASVVVANEVAGLVVRGL